MEFIAMGSGGVTNIPRPGRHCRICVEASGKRTILTHMEEGDQRSYDDYLALEEELKKFKLQFAYDDMRIHV